MGIWTQIWALSSIRWWLVIWNENGGDARYYKTVLQTWRLRKSWYALQKPNLFISVRIGWTRYWNKTTRTIFFAVYSIPVFVFFGETLPKSYLPGRLATGMGQTNQLSPASMTYQDTQCILLSIYTVSHLLNPVLLCKCLGPSHVLKGQDETGIELLASGLIKYGSHPRV